VLLEPFRAVGMVGWLIWNFSYLVGDDPAGFLVDEEHSARFAAGLCGSTCSGGTSKHAPPRHAHDHHSPFPWST